MTFVTQTRYYRSEDLHLKFAANPGPEGWYFHSLRLEAETDGVNFAIGEGPNKHQRYILFSSLPSEETKSTALEHVLHLEEVRGCTVAADGEGKKGPRKKALNNFYLWKNERGGFQFTLSPVGKIVHAVNHTTIGVVSREGGRRSKARFFNTLKWSMLAVPPFAGSFIYAIGSDEPVEWETDCAQIYLGLCDLVREVYGRKMTLLEGEDIHKDQVRYRGRFVPGTSVLRIRAESGPFSPVAIRVSGLKGKLWIEGYKRDIYLDLAQKRILKDILEISFGNERNKSILDILGDKNIVRLSLVDECFLGCEESDRAIRTASRACSPDRSEKNEAQTVVLPGP